MALLVTALAGGLTFAMNRQHRSARPRCLIGYSEFRTNLPTRFANVCTRRACVVRADGTGRRELAAELIKGPYTWTGFDGWCPDGRLAVIICG